MFEIEQVQLQFDVQNDIQDLKISDNQLYLSTHSSVYRIDLLNPEIVTEFKIINQGNDQIEETFLDPKGYHLLIKTKNLAYHYINKEFTNQSKILHKLKGFDITCVEFCFESIDDNLIELSNTGSIFVGTRFGIIYELVIDASSLNNDYFNNKLEKIVKQIYKIDNDSIHGIQLVPLSEKNLFNVLVVTAQKTIAFENYKISKYHHKSSNFSDLSRLTATELYKQNNDAIVAHNQRTLALLNSKTEELLLVSSHNLNMNQFKLKYGGGKSRSIMLSQFHAFILLGSKLASYNQLNGELALELMLDSDEVFLGLTTDSLQKTFWLYSSSNLYEILIENESKNIWQIMLDKKLYDEALDSLSTNDIYTRDLVLIGKADDLYDRKRVLEAAEVYSRTSKATEEVLLLFKDDLFSTLTYLTKKHAKVPKPQVMQKITLSSWIVEIYMEILNKLDDQISTYKNSTILNSTQTKMNCDSNDKITAEELEQKFAAYSSDLEKFLKSNISSLHQKTIYQIMAAHNRKKELLFYSNLIHDYDAVLSFHVNLSKWKEALKVLLVLFGETKDNKANLQYVYKYSSVLMMNEPHETIQTWMKIDNFMDLDFTQLLPAMIAYNKIVCKSVKASENETLKLLKYLIDEKANKEKIIHNTYLCLMISYPSQDGEGEILKYLETHVGDESNSSSKKEILFDTDIILRLCHKFKKVRAIIYIYSISGEYEEALKLALENDLIELASIIADRPAKRLDYSFIQEETDENNRFRKKLWLKVAEKLIKEVLRNDKYLTQVDGDLVVGSEKGDPVDLNKKDSSIQRVLRFILEKANKHASVRLVTIQDLLELFPDFTVIDNFKDEIVDSLQKYSSDLSKLQDDMNKALATSVELKEELNELSQNRFLTVEPKESCAICDKLLITRKFFTYPCFHSFHQDCLVDYYKNSNNYKVKNKLYILEKKLVSLNKSSNSAGINQVKHEINETLCEKCAFCTMKISEIDVSLTTGSRTSIADDGF